MTTILTVTSDPDIQQCYPVMSQLRPHIAPEDFLPRIKAQMADGYMLSCIKKGDLVVAVAGFRIGRNLAWGKHLYVDDLVTDSQNRSSGYGRKMIDWIILFAKEKGCEQLHLDSGIQRTETHKFYKREGLELASYHFSKKFPS